MNEKKKGLDWDDLMDVPGKKEEIGSQYQTPGFGLAAQLFCCVAKCVMEKMGPEQGEALLKEAVEHFGKERGRRIAQRVKVEGKPLTFRNWLIYTDIDSDRNFSAEPDIQDGEDQHTNGRLAHTSLTAEKAGPAEYDTCDGAKEKIFVLVQRDIGHASGVDEPPGTGGDCADCHAGQDDSLCANPGQAGGFSIAAGCVDISPETGVLQNEMRHQKNCCRQHRAVGQEVPPKVDSSVSDR